MRRAQKKPQKNCLDLANLHGKIYYKNVEKNHWGLDVAYLTQLKIDRKPQENRVQLIQKRHSQSLKKLFQEYNVPSFVRAYYPYIYLDGCLIALPNIGICKNKFTQAIKKSDGQNKVVQLFWNFW